MEDELINQIVQVAPLLTTQTVLLMAWMFERRRADRLEAIALHRIEKQEQIEMMQKGEV